MKRLVIITGLVIATVSATPAFADSYVRGYTRSNGTSVQPYYRSNADSNSFNNFSTQGNTNPYTGTRGTRNYDSSYSPSSYSYPSYSPPSYSYPSYSSPNYSSPNYSYPNYSYPGY